MSMPDGSDTMLFEDLRCPVCRNELQDNGKGIRCTGCNQQFRYDNGIPDLRLRRFDYYFNPIPKDRMRSLSEELGPDNWVSSVREFIDLAPNPNWVDNIAVQGRYAWKVLMSLPPKARVLDIGCGLGALISSVAPHVKVAYATDLTIERLIFANGRFRVFNAADDVRAVASGDGPHLPFSDASFDAVFVSGVLEWVGEGDTSSFTDGSKWDRLIRMLRAHFGDTNPRAIQLRFLKDVRRILKPEGELYVGIENRLSHTYFGQRRDHHSSLWFGSLMPRVVATLYSVVARRRPYRTYTYSLRGYQRLFSAAGFASTDIFGFNDGYSNLRAITPAKAKVDRWTPDAPRTWRDRLSRHPYLVPAFGILASPGHTPRDRLLDRLLAEIEERLDGPIDFGSFEVSRHDKAILRGTCGDRAVLIKLPMSRESKKSESRGASLLRKIHSDFPQVRHWTPMALTEGMYQNQAYFVETRISGIPLKSGASAGDVPAAVVAVRSALDSAVAGAEPVTFDVVFERHVLPRLAVLGGALDNDGAIDLLTNFFREELVDMPFRRGLMHGDMSLDHALFQDGQLTGLVDWHAGAVDGLPVIDAVGLAVSAVRMESPDRPLPEILEWLAGGPWHRTAAGPALYGFLDDTTMRPGHLRGAIYLYWLFHVSNRLPFRLQYESATMGRLISPVLDQIKAHRLRAA